MDLESRNILTYFTDLFWWNCWIIPSETLSVGSLLCNKFIWKLGCQYKVKLTSFMAVKSCLFRKTRNFFTHFTILFLWNCSVFSFKIPHRISSIYKEYLKNNHGHWTTIWPSKQPAKVALRSERKHRHSDRETRRPISADSWKWSTVIKLFPNRSK